MKSRGAFSIALILILAMGEAGGQYFGRNKVRYRDFPFTILHTPHFEIYYYTHDKILVTNAAEMLERWHERYTKIFGFSLKKQLVILYGSPGDFEQTNVIAGLIPQEVGGVTESFDRRIAVALTGISADDDHVLGHELVHAFQFALIDKLRSTSLQSISFPTWFLEGMAEYLSLGGNDPLTAMWMRDAVESGRLPTLKQAADDSRYFPYRFGHAIWSYIAGVYGDSMIAPLIIGVMNNGWNSGYRQTLGIAYGDLSNTWQRVMHETFSARLTGRGSGSRIGRVLVSGDGGYNLSPSLSPDGRQVAFVSLRGIFTFDLYLADVATGAVVRKLASSDRDRYFEAVSYINSAGAWSPDGASFVMAVFEHGKNKIARFDIKTGTLLQTIDIRSIDAIYQISWSPDGNELALFGTSGGRGALYAYSFADSTVRRLTFDGYSDIEPAWSPDGKTIAFATDRGPMTALDSLMYGPMRIGFFDVETGAVATVAMAPGVVHSNPQYSPDGQSVFFIADPDGVPDVYRYEISTQRFFRVTNVSTGISGLTRTAPALSVSAKAGTIAVTVFEKGKYAIYSLPDSAGVGTPYPETDPAARETAVSLPPSSGGTIVGSYLRDFTTGLIDSSACTTSGYRPSLGLVYGGQLYGGLAADYFGLGIVGGAYLLFSDVLGDHMLGVGLQLNGGLLDFGGQVEYLNQSRRFNWGFAASHIPYRSAAVAFGNDSIVVNDTVVPVQTTSVFDQRMFDDELSALSQYPLSANRRLEFSAGLARYSYNIEEERTVTSPNGEIVSKTTSKIHAPAALNQINASAAYVGDYSFEGFTGPISGTRYRFELDPTTGSLTYITAVVDYRYYYFVRPLTFAIRGLTVGRYLKDSESGRLVDQFIGYPTLVRGYSAESFDLSNCGSDSVNGDCGMFNRLTGSRMMVANVEARLPLLGTQHLGIIDFRYLPTDLIVFFDGGVAWKRSNAPEWKFTGDAQGRSPVFSTGLAMRFNIMNIFILQIFFVYPFDRPGKGAFFDFVFAPAW